MGIKLIYFALFTSFSLHLFVNTIVFILSSDKYKYFPGIGQESISLNQASTTVNQVKYLFIDLDGERHYMSTVSHPRTQYHDSPQGLSLD